MKKCPECGNPSYDGAPVCGNCGYKFPKPKHTVTKEENIFKEEPKFQIDSSNETTGDSRKENKLVLGAIVVITLIVIIGIFATGNTNEGNSTLVTSELSTITEGDFSFDYPSNWEKVNGSDEDHPNAMFFKNENNTNIEFYNVTNDASSLKEITQNRISYAQKNGAYIDTFETITLDGRNVSNFILENADGNYTRFISMFSDGMLYVFKINGDSPNSIKSSDIESMINSADIK